VAERRLKSLFSVAPGGEPASWGGEAEEI